MSTGNQFEDRLDDYLNRHARSATNWKYTSAGYGIEAIAPVISSLLVDEVAVVNGLAARALEERVAAVLVRAYLAGWDHASDYVREAGSEALADKLYLHV